MSAYSETSTQFTDPYLLIEALREMGFAEVQDYIGQPQQLEGYHGDKRKQTADIIVPRRAVGMASNDIGFVRGADGKFGAIISDYDSLKYDAKWLGKLKATYAEKGILRQAMRAGLRFAGRKQKDGKVELQFVKA